MVVLWFCYGCLMVLYQGKFNLLTSSSFLVGILYPEVEDVLQFSFQDLLDKLDLHKGDI